MQYCILTILFSIFLFKGNANDNIIKTETSINIRISDAKKNDTLTLLIFEHNMYPYTATQYSHIERISTMNKDGLFNFTISNLPKACYISIGKERNIIASDKFLYILNMYLVEPSDSITILITPSEVKKDGVRPGSKYAFNYNFLFSGRNSEKYALRNEIDKILHTNTMLRMDRLQTYKKKLSSLAYQIIYTDINTESKSKNLQLIYTAIQRSIRSNDSAALFYQKKIFFENSYLPITNLPEEILLSSRFLPDYYILKAQIESKLSLGKENQTAYSILKEISLVKFREKIITRYLIENYSKLNEPDSILFDAMKLITTPYYSNNLKDLYNSKTGKEAFPFSLPDSKGKITELGDFKGKVIFMDFWFTGCGACQGFYKHHLSRVEKVFENNPDVVFVTVSIDRSRERWIESINGGKYTSHLATNLYTAGQGIDHSIIKHYKITGYPRPLLIDRNGIILNTNAKDLLNSEKLISLIHDAILYK